MKRILLATLLTVASISVAHAQITLSQEPVGTPAATDVVPFTQGYTGPGTGVTKNATVSSILGNMTPAEINAALLNQPLNLGNGALTAAGVTAALSASTNAATGGTASQTMAGFGRTHMTVEDFGAKGDCSTDDGPAFNAYAAQIRANTGYGSNFTIEFGESKCYRIVTPVDFAGINDIVTVEGHGSLLVGAVGSTHAIISAMHTAINFNQLDIVSQGSVLTGIQAGNDGSVGSDLPISLNNVHFDGSYINAPLYVRAAELSSYIHSTFVNRYAGGYTVIMDGECHWAIDTTYGADSCTPNTYQSFNEQTFVNDSFNNLSGTAGSSAMWWGGQGAHWRFIDSYAIVGSASPIVVVYNGVAGGNNFRNITWDVHTEVGPSAEFFFTGVGTSSGIGSLDYENSEEQVVANGSIFEIDGTSTIASVSLPDLRMQIGGVLNSGVTVFDQPAKYAGTENVSLPTGISWNGTVSAFTGCVTSGTAMGCHAPLPPPIPVGSLPTCNSTTASEWLAVSNAASPTYGALLTGGGTVPVPVYCDGTNWRSY